jgi:hypothetical protein
MVHSRRQVAVDAHHVRANAALERDALALAPFCHHGFAPALNEPPPRFNARGSKKRLRRG